CGGTEPASVESRYITPAHRDPRRQPDGRSGSFSRRGVPFAVARASGQRRTYVRSDKRRRLGRHLGRWSGATGLGARRRRTGAHRRAGRERWSAWLACGRTQRQPVQNHRAGAKAPHQGDPRRHGSAAELRAVLYRLFPPGLPGTGPTVQRFTDSVSPSGRCRQRCLESAGWDSSDGPRRAHRRRQCLAGSATDAHNFMIELREVSKTVTSGSEPLTILYPLTTTIPRGQFVAIVGPSGSGKSTLLGLLAGLDAPTTGSVWIDGVDITKLDEDGLAKLRGEKIGFVFQFFHLIPSLTAHENVAVPMEIKGMSDAGVRARKLLEEVGLTGRAHHYPSQLSGGEQQRVALARALANDPPIVLADEPTGNLDTTNGRHIMEILQRIHRTRHTTLVLVTHDAELAAVADARISLRDGRVV